jgi:hypothetical protein
VRRLGQLRRGARLYPSPGRLPLTLCRRCRWQDERQLGDAGVHEAVRDSVDLLPEVPEDLTASLDSFVRISHIRISHLARRGCVPGR